MAHHTGMNLAAALREARRLGARVRRVNRTGELLVSHPSTRRRVRLNCRRKDAPRSLTTFLHKLAP